MRETIIEALKKQRKDLSENLKQVFWIVYTANLEVKVDWTSLKKFQRLKNIFLHRKKSNTKNDALLGLVHCLFWQTMKNIKRKWWNM